MKKETLTCSGSLPALGLPLRKLFSDMELTWSYLFGVVWVRSVIPLHCQGPTPTLPARRTPLTSEPFLQCLAFLKPQPQEQSDCWSPSVSFHTSSRASPPPAAFPNSVFAVCIFYSTSILWLLIAENHTTFVQEKPQHLSSFDPLC